MQFNNDPAFSFSQLCLNEMSAVLKRIRLIFYLISDFSVTALLYQHRIIIDSGNEPDCIIR